jgi:hypothetical protein
VALHLFAILGKLAIERLAINPEEVSRLGFLPRCPLQGEQDICPFEVRQRAREAVLPWPTFAGSEAVHLGVVQTIDQGTAMDAGQKAA